MLQNTNLLIVGAGIYGAVAAEIAADMQCFENIDFVDDEKTVTANGKVVVGTTNQLNELVGRYSHIVVAIGNPQKRLSILKEIEEELPFHIATLVSPRAHISQSVKIGKGCIIEPMAVIHTNCEIATGCIISAGAVINHFSVCGDGVHVDCNATVEGCCTVPAGVKVCSGEVYKQKREF